MIRAFAARTLSRPGRWATVAAWLVLAVLLAPPGAKLAEVTNDDYVLPGGSQTAQLQKVLRDRFPGGDERLVLLVYRRDGGLTDADEQRILADAGAVAELPQVGQPLAAFAPGSPENLVSADGAVAVTAVPLHAGEVFHVKEVIEELRSVQSESAGLETHVTGFPALIADVNSAIKEADVKLLGVTVVLVLILLIAVYRSPALALLPIVVVGIAYAVSAGIVYLLNQHAGLPVDSTATSLLLVLMFGAGTDYCLLLVARYRSALRTNERPRDAMVVAMTEAGPAIVASGLTVIAALLVMLAAVFGLNRTLGPVNAIGVALVLVASLTLLPAALVILGRRAFWPNAASVAYGGAERPEGGAAGGLWQRLGTAVRRRPAPALLLSVAVLGVAALGLARHDDALSPVEQFRSSSDGVLGYEVVRSAFPPGTVAPTTVLVERLDGPVQPADLAGVTRTLSAVEGVVAVTDTGRRSDDGRAAALSAVFADDPFADPALARVEALRAEAKTVDPALRVLVGQGSGERLDFLDGARRDLWTVAPLVLAVVLLTLIVLLRAVVAPLYLLGTVVLSFLGTMGASLVVFDVVFGQEAIDPAIPLVVFIFLVALGCDYNIFLMSRVREEALVYGTPEGMYRGLVATGPVITSAGLVLAGTFSVLVVLPVYALVEIGFAVALGVLVDTFLVRSICVPAIAWLVGERSWWPSRLGRPEGRKAPAAPPPVALPELTRPPETRADRPVVGTFRPELVIRIGADGRHVAVEGPVLVGRDPAAGVALVDDPLVSSRHARLLPGGRGVLVVDLGSRNGTYLDGVPLSGPALARPGSRILVGTTSLEVDQLETPSFQLAFLTGAEGGRTLPISGSLIAGRDPGADIALTWDERVSRRHARLTATATGVLVEDLGSQNGAFVNGARVEQPMVAWLGDRIDIGETTLEVRLRPSVVHALQVVDGPDAGRSLRVDEPVEVGRGPSAGFRLEKDERMSRLHARVTPIEDGLIVEDLGSSNGTTVNGARVVEPVQALVGDRVVVGSTSLKVVREQDLAVPRTRAGALPDAG